VSTQLVVLLLLMHYLLLLVLGLPVSSLQACTKQGLQWLGWEAYAMAYSYIFMHHAAGDQMVETDRAQIWLR